MRTHSKTNKEDALKRASEALEKLSTLFDNLPVERADKKSFCLEERKHSSAWYACLVNTNIDPLLIPEYLDSRLCRNILIKKETEQFYRTVEKFGEHDFHDDKSFYEEILYKENSGQKESIDLFSSQTDTERTICPAELKDLFESWEQNANQETGLQMTLQKFMSWFNLFGRKCSGQRQMIMWLKYGLWSLYGDLSFRFGTEEFLFRFSNREKGNTEDLITAFAEHLFKKSESLVNQLQELYRREVGWEHMKSRQKLLSGHLFDMAFILNLPGISRNETDVLRVLSQKGFIGINDIVSTGTELTYQAELESLISSGIAELAEENGEVILQLSSRLRNGQSSLEAYKNILNPVKNLKIDSFLNQQPVRPVVSLSGQRAETEIAEPVKAQSHMRRKVFFG